MSRFVPEVLLEQEEYLFGVNRFQDIFIASGQVSFSLALVRRICCKHQDRYIFPFLTEHPDAFNTIDQGDKEIHQDKINLLIFPVQVINKLFSVVENPDIGA